MWNFLYAMHAHVLYVSPSNDDIYTDILFQNKRMVVALLVFGFFRLNILIEELGDPSESVPVALPF